MSLTGSGFPSLTDLHGSDAFEDLRPGRLHLHAVADCDAADLARIVDVRAQGFFVEDSHADLVRLNAGDPPEDRLVRALAFDLDG